MKNTDEKGAAPIKRKEEVEQSKDQHIAQDFEGYPHNPAKENVINPKSKEDRLTAKMEEPKAKDKQIHRLSTSKKAIAGETSETEDKAAKSVARENKMKNKPNAVKKVIRQSKP